MSKKISNVALLTFEGAAFNVTLLALLLILVYPSDKGTCFLGSLAIGD
jgi:hypothetical protein